MYFAINKHLFKLALCILFPIMASANNTEPYYFTSSLKEGEGVWSLLRRYKIANHCSLELFYSLNNIKTPKKVHPNKPYKLPIKIYQYDNKSIRSTVGITDWETAISIKEYNELILSKSIRKTHYADSKILWVPTHIIDCALESKATDSNSKEADKKEIIAEKKAPSKKVSSKKSSYKLFGEKYAEYEIVDQSLKDQVFYIVAGHGGPDPGAICDDLEVRLCEDEYAYDVCLRLARNLMQHGAKVEMIIQDPKDGIRDGKYLRCDYDEKCGPTQKIPRNQKRRLKQRAARINHLYAKYKKQGYKTHKAIVVHIDANRANKRQDVFFYHHIKSQSSRRLAYKLQSTFEKKYEKYQKGRGYSGSVSARGLYMINYTHPPTVFVELGNIQNRKDQKRLLLNTNRQALANWLFEGLIGN